VRVSYLLAIVGLLSSVLLWTAGDASPDRRLPVAEPIVVSEAYEVVVDHLRRNETMTHLLERHDVTGREAFQLLQVAREVGLDPRRVRPELEFEFKRKLGTTHLLSIRSRIESDAFMHLTRDTTGTWVSNLALVDWTVSVHRVEGVIRASLNQSIHEVVPDSVLPFGERDRLVWNAAEAVYGWVLDFTRDIRPGDEFQIAFERLTSTAGDVRYGRVLAAKLVVQGRPYSAYAMENTSGRMVYYDADGRSLHRAFLKYPVQFRRISSGFNRRRFHPVLKRYRAHLGYDFAADRGTPIRATGNGVVRTAGRNGGYGLMVGIRHPKSIETRYAHMSRIARGIRPGTRVTQGQTIGYVGMTGLANGPHVHYEFLKNGRHVNYRNVDLGDGEPLPTELSGEFRAVRLRYDEVLNRLPVRIPLLLGGE
jgi:murein DD-endopeptidase MepM/ murein hydrolase activator NlpD